MHKVLIIALVSTITLCFASNTSSQSNTKTETPKEHTKKLKPKEDIQNVTPAAGGKKPVVDVDRVRG